MEEKMMAKLDGTKAAVKAVETKAPVKEVTAEVKENKTVEVKAEETKKPAAETKTVAKKTVKETTKAKKTTKTAAKKAEKAEKEELKPEVYIQFQEKEAVVADAIEKAKAEFVGAGHRVSSIKSLQIYLKPEEGAAYYVINQKVAGRVELF